MKKELTFKPTQIQEKITKESHGASNYDAVSSDEMDYMMECALKYQKLQEAWVKGIDDKEPTILFLRKCKEVIEDFKMPTVKAMK